MTQGYIFLSYRNIEKEFALKLAADLKRAGVHLWMDRLDGIKVGMAWTDTIEQSINNCAALIAVLSPDYLKSDICKNELARAKSLNRPIFPVLLHTVSPENWPVLIQRTQYEDFTNWREQSDYEEHLNRLLQVLKTYAIDQIGDVPDAETQYLINLIAKLETHRGVLEYVELEGETDNSHNIHSQPIFDDEWGFAELVRDVVDGTPITNQKIPLKNIAEAVAKYSRFVLIGDPGAGKTTTIRRLALDAARKRLDNPHASPLPLLLYLPQWRNESTVTDYLQEYWSLTGNLIGLLMSGNILLYLDGLNEMGVAGTQKIVRLREWIHSSNAPAHIIVTCRAKDYLSDTKDPLLGNIPIVCAQDLEPSQIKQFVTNYLKEKADGLLVQIFPTDDEISRQQYWSAAERERIETRSLLRLARNPYMLSALILLYQKSPTGELPRNIGSLFQRLVRALWARGEKRRTTNEWKFEELETALARLAFAIIDEDQPLEVPTAYAIEKSGDFQVLQIGANASYLIIHDGYVRFYHQLILEYFAAIELDQRDIGEVIIASREKARSGDPYLADPEKRKQILLNAHGMYGVRFSEKWDQVIVSLVGFTANLEKHVQEMVKVDTHLAARGITSGRALSNSVYDYILAILLSDDNDPMFAVQSIFPLLVAAKELRVIHPLIQLLAEGNFMRIAAPASQLLVLMGTDAIPALIESLINAGSQVRSWVATILGQIKDPRSVPALIKALSDKSGRYEGYPVYTCDEAAKALQQIGTPEALEAIENWKPRGKS